MLAICGCELVSLVELCNNAFLSGIRWFQKLYGCYKCTPLYIPCSLFESTLGKPSFFFFLKIILCAFGRLRFFMSQFYLWQGAGNVHSQSLKCWGSGYGPCDICLGIFNIQLIYVLQVLLYREYVAFTLF